MIALALSIKIAAAMSTIATITKNRHDEQSIMEMQMQKTNGIDYYYCVEE